MPTRTDRTPPNDLAEDLSILPPMAATSGVLSPDVNFADRLVPSLEEMTRVVSHLRGLGYRMASEGPAR